MSHYECIYWLVSEATACMRSAHVHCSESARIRSAHSTPSLCTFALITLSACLFFVYTILHIHSLTHPHSLQVCHYLPSCHYHCITDTVYHAVFTWTLLPGWMEPFATDDTYTCDSLLAHEYIYVIIICRAMAALTTNSVETYAACNSSSSSSGGGSSSSTHYQHVLHY